MLGTSSRRPTLSCYSRNKVSSSSSTPGTVVGSNVGYQRDRATEAILGMSVLERADAVFIRSQGIGTLDLLTGQAESVLRSASEARRTLGSFHAPNNRPPR